MAKKKLKRNITGLRNQPKTASHVEEALVDNAETAEKPNQPVIDADHDEDQDKELDNDDEGWDGHVRLDTNKLFWGPDNEEEDSEEEDPDDHDEGDVEDEVTAVGEDEWRNDGLHVGLMVLAIEIGDDPRDEDWIPDSLRRKHNARIARARPRPKFYQKGPDVGSKAERTQRRYKDLLKGQQTLENLGFTRAEPRVQSRATTRTPEASLCPSSPEMISDEEIETNLPEPIPDLQIKVEDNSPSPSASNFTLPSSEPEDDHEIHVRQESPDTPVLEFDVPIRQESVTPPPLYFERSRSPSVRIRQESMTPPRLFFDRPTRKRKASRELETDESEEETKGDDDDEQQRVDEVDVQEAESAEAWEEELDETLTPNAEIRDWGVLRSQIKADLKKKHKSLPLSQINQLMILRNFANLRLKGYGRIEASFEIARQWHEKDGSNSHFARRIRALARHYQVFEQLPKERRGGYKNARSLLKDEIVRTAARSWLTEQPIGSITPNNFMHALNKIILPSLGMSPSKPLCERTARRWLVKLGWTRTILRKGVYMDGHERPDVVEYREKVFLPKMKEFERRMARYEGPDLNRVEPNLRPGERELIAEFQDETCAQANDHKPSAWLREGQQILQKKGRGRLIHISEWVEEVNGRLVVKNADGVIIKRARKIIHPGSNGDPYWDCQQLIEQVKTQAIPVFEEAHPGCQALFVFDQSSAHAALPPDALKAFEMNKSNGGKQRRQKDTVIPESNPYPEFRGKIQKMTTENGEQKGLQQTLEERGFNVSNMRAKCSPICPWENDKCCMARLLSKQEDFANQVSMLETLIKEAGHECIFLPKFHCELNPIEMYWGWVKYRYRQVQKKTFEDAKQAALDALDSCPVDVIRKFINRSWRFMDAYRVPLSGKAAAWAVRKQKGHRTVSQTAMLHLDAIMNPT